jgi:hypothetical protein
MQIEKDILRKPIKKRADLRIPGSNSSAVVDACSAMTVRICSVEMSNSEALGGEIVMRDVLGNRPWCWI